MKKWFFILFLITVSCGPTTVQKGGSQGVTADTGGPITRILLQTNSPSSISTPSFLVQGNFLIGYTINLHTNSTCTSPIGSAIAQNNYSVVVTSLPLSKDGTYNFYANVTSNISGTSACSPVYATYNYETGSSPPNVTVLTNSGPSFTPIVSVNDIQFGASISLYTNSTCSGFPVGSENFINSSFTQIQATLPAYSQDGPYQFWALQTLGDKTICSEPSNVYTLNTKPQYIQVLNASPGMNLNPTVRIGNGNVAGGALVPGSLVKLYMDPTCSTSTYVGEKQAGSTDISVDITINSDLTTDGNYKFYSTQGFCPINTVCPTTANYRTSPCSLVYGSYELDTSPTIALASPSPSMNPFPTFTVTGMVPGWRADVYSQAGCQGPVMGSAVASGSSVNITLNNSLPAISGNYTFTAKQNKFVTVRRGSISTIETSFFSACSDNFATYTFDSPKVLITSPNPGNSINPTITVTNLDSNASNTVSIYPSTDCTGTVVTSTNTLGNFSATLTIPSSAVSSDGTYFFSSKQTKGNTACLGSTSYVLDTKPNNFKYINPNSNKGNIPTPTFSVSNIANYATPTVSLHQMSDCSDPAVATATGSFPTVNLTLNSTAINSEGSKTYFSKQVFTGHTPKCSTDSITYTYNITPTLLSIVGQPSGNNPRPIIQVDGLSTAATKTVQIYRGTTSCETLMGQAIGVPATATMVDIVSDVIPSSIQGPVNYFAKQIIGTVTSSCSSVFTTYNINTYLSSIKILTGSGPQTVASGETNNPTIQVSGFANNSTVEIFSTPNCTSGSLLGSAVIPSTNSSEFVNIISNPLNVEGANNFYGRQTLGTYIGPCSGAINLFATYNLNSRPEAPRLITATPGTTLTPTIRATNIIPGALVEVFTDNNCSVVMGSKTAATTQVDVTVSSSTPLLIDGTYYFYIRQINNGHISPCSGASDPYTLNTTPTGISVASTPYEILPEPKWNLPNPTIQVSGVTPGASVVLYKDENCTQVIGSTVPNSTNANIVVTDGSFSVDGKYPLYARQSYGGHTSFCSGNSSPIVSGEYNLVTKPTLSYSTASPNNLLKPSVNLLNSVNGSFMQLYSTPACDVGSEISNIYLSTGGNQTLKVDEGLTVNGLNKIYGRQSVPLSGGTFQNSPCSDALNYTLATTPNISLVSSSPSSLNTPSFTVSNLFSESDIGTKTFAIYSDAGCTYQVSPTTNITSTAMTISIDPITTVGTSTFYAKQNASDPTFNSPCSTTGASYKYDLSPFVTMVTPSPNEDLTPEVNISNAVVGSTVTLYFDNECTNSIQSTVASATSFDWQLGADLPTDGTYNFYANQVTGGTTSLCSSVFATYDLDTTDFLIQPASASGTSTTPVINVSNINPGDIITLYSDGNCSAVMSGASTSIGTSVSITSLPISTYEVNHKWWAKRKIGTFTSPCAGPSSTYVLNIMPSTISVVSPNPGTTLSPTFNVGGVNNNSTVTIFSNGTCSAANELGSAVVGPSSTSVNVTLRNPMAADGILTVWARQLSNGNLSQCSTASASYTLDTDPKTLTLVSAGTSNPTPIISTSGVEPGATVKLYVNDPNCNSTVMGTAIVPNNATSTNVTSYPLSIDGNYTYYAKQFYPNSSFVSSCSTSSVYYPLSSAPTSLQLLTTNPTSSSTPKILVSGVNSGDWVYLFTDSNCNFQSGSNISLGSSVQIQTLPALTASDTYTFYAKRIQGGGQGLQSSCSSASVNLNYNPAFFSDWLLNNDLGPNPPAANNFFGSSVSTSNNYSVVGVPGANGVGAVYLYSYNGFAWSSAGTLTSPSLNAGDNFGYAVDLFTSSPSGNIANGDLLIVGAPGPFDNSRVGRAFVYTYSNGTWTNEREFLPTNLFIGANFGASVSINSFMAVIGAPGANGNNGTIRYFGGSSGIFTAEAIVNPPAGTPAGSQFGFAVSANGTNFVASAPMGTGNQLVYFYSQGPTLGPGITNTTFNEQFGYSLDLSNNSLIVGAPNGTGGGYANIYSYVVAAGIINPNFIIKLTAPANAQRFGESVAINSNNLAVVGQLSTTATLRGQTYIYPGPTFSNSNNVALPNVNGNANDQFGASASIFEGSIIIGAPGTGAGSSAGASFLYRNDQ